MIQTKTYYETADGRQFSDRKEAEKHEKIALKEKEIKKLSRFLTDCYYNNSGKASHQPGWDCLAEHLLIHKRKDILEFIEEPVL